jgi:hypothetical protein
MINPDYYNKANAVQTYLGGKIQHYLRRSPTVVLQSFPFILQRGDDMYTLAIRLFGDDQEQLWPIVAGINDLREPDEWFPGDVVNIPKVILTDVVDKQIADYQNAESTSTVIQP